LEQVGDDGLCGDDGPYRGRFSGRAEDVLRELGINTPLGVLDAIECYTGGDVLGFHITELNEALQTICDPPVSAP